MGDPIPLSFVRCEGLCENCPVARHTQRQQPDGASSSQGSERPPSEPSQGCPSVTNLAGHRVEVLCDDGIWRAGRVISWGGKADNGEEGVLRVAFDPVRPDDANGAGPITGSKKRSCPEQTETGSTSAPKLAKVGAFSAAQKPAVVGTPQTLTPPAEQHDTPPRNKPDNGGSEQPLACVAGGIVSGHTRFDSRNASRGSAVGERSSGGKQGQGPAKPRGVGSNSGLAILARVAETEAARKGPGTGPGTARQDTMEHLTSTAADVLRRGLGGPKPLQPLWNGASTQVPALKKVEKVGANPSHPMHQNPPSKSHLAQRN